MEFKLSDLCIGGKGSYGIGASAVPYDPNKYTYLRITDINEDGSLNFADLKSVDDEDSYKYLLQELGTVQVKHISIKKNMVVLFTQDSL